EVMVRKGSAKSSLARECPEQVADGGHSHAVDFFKEHLAWLHKGIEEGSNCFSFHAWTPIDCWSWMNAYKNRYGYIALDLATQQKTIKKSGYWMRDVIANNGF
ncbi:MAG: glycoside hydrolase family 1 protein, partial [Selenomonas sp.]|nr:glycoside hydrolase family 1 protein [Selenomonas sp.]